MQAKKRSLRLRPEEDKLLRTLYRQFGIPTDQYPQRPTDLANLLETWNGLTGRTDASEELLHYMFTKRKKGKWERLGSASAKQPQILQQRFSEDDLKHLDSIYEELQVAADNYALDTELGKKLQDEFARRTGRIVPQLILCSAMISRRKAGALTTLRPKSDDSDLGYNDIDEVAS